MRFEQPSSGQQPADFCALRNCQLYKSCSFVEADRIARDTPSTATRVGRETARRVGANAGCKTAQQAR